MPAETEVAGGSATAGHESRKKWRIKAVGLGLLVAATVWNFQFMITSRMVGGTDAAWYGYTMIDAVEQVRAGHWPVFTGQGEFQWNGAVHPFRTAPYFQNFGILIDTLTLHRLTPLMVEHLAVLGAILQGVLLIYFLLARLEPRAWWLAWVAALAWLLAPLVTDYVVNMEMFMTIMTFCWLPLLFYGNIRVIQRDDWSGWTCVAASLALVWMSHSPSAAWATVITSIMQLLRLLIRDFNLKSWGRAVGGGVQFVVFAAYFLYSVAELPPAKDAVSIPFGVGDPLLYLGFAAGVRLLAGGTWKWSWLGLAVLAALWPANRLYFNWAAGFLAWTALVRGCQQGGRWQLIASRALECALAGLLLSAFVAVRLPYVLEAGALARANASIQFLRNAYPTAILPIALPAIVLGDLQMGYTLWFFAAAGSVMALWHGTWEARLLAFALVIMTPLMVPIPGITDCLEMCIPDFLNAFSAGGWFRLLPAFSFLAVFTGFMSLSALRFRAGPAGRKAVAGVAVLVAVGFGWDVTEVAKLQDRGKSSVSTAEATAGYLRDEMASPDFNYHPLTKPGYVLNGVMDYRLESRLLDAKDFRLLPEPLLDAPTGVEVTLTSTPNPLGLEWLILAPKIQLEPGERAIWKFEFFDKNYDGVLFTRGPGGFNRHYYLPLAGPGEKSFAVAKDKPKTLSYWNSLKTPQQIELNFLLPAAKPGFGDFAKLKIQRYREDELQIHTIGLMPYHARVKTAVASFLETPRVYLPGYRAKVDGQAVPAVVSPDSMVMVRLEPGTHDVVVAYRPTAKLALAGAVSACGWLGLVFLGVRRLCR